jgi:hypothetical protein
VRACASDSTSVGAIPTLQGRRMVGHVGEIQIISGNLGIAF